MGTTSFTICSGCNRHVRCGERACPFCGVSVASFACVLEYRIKTGLDRGRAMSLGAALAAAGFASGCDLGTGGAVYGAPCNPPSCVFPGGGTSNGGAGTGGLGGGGGASGTPTGGVAGAGASAGSAGTAGTAGHAGSGGTDLETGGSGGDESGGAAGAGGSALSGAGALGGAAGNN